MIYASNLCHEIAQNVGFTNLAEEIINEDGTITTKTNTGDMVTCNLNSISLGRITDEELEENIALQIRMLDNVISINQAPVPESRMTSDKYRAIGLGTSGYHHYLVNHDIQWESDEHIEVADKLFENIAYYSIKASMELVKKKVHTLHSKVPNGKLVHTSRVVATHLIVGNNWLQTLLNTVSAMVT